MPAQGIVFWLTGRPAAGKTTLAQALVPLLEARGYRPVVLDSDEMRQILTPEPTYSAEERDWFYGVLGRLASWLEKQGFCAIVAATAHRQDYRDQARQMATHFYEIYVQCDLATARERDPKGIYARAAAGEAEAVPGVGVPYEAPSHPEAVVDTGRLSPSAAALSIMNQLALPAR